MSTLGNTYLSDEAVQRQLAKHDSHLIKGTTTWFPGEDPEIHWDFNRAKEYELLGAYLEQFSDIDFRDGHVTVDDAAKAVYGSDDQYLRTRIAETHLSPASGFNKTLSNGEVVIVGADGAIIRGDRVRVATERFQLAADNAQHRIDKVSALAARRLGAERKRSLRIAPSAESGLLAITEHTVDATSEQLRINLNSQ